ncbi:MAG: aromatic ring-hydroxylating dioxygenase subunit alpha, partial [Actinomycetota bacterium]
MTAAIDWTDESTWAGTRQRVEAAHTLAPACYTDEAFFALEQERVFAASWVCVGVAADLWSADGGRRHLVRQVAGESLFITTNADGAVRAYLNTCRHRGTELAADDGPQGEVIRCPYHRWGYSLEGSLMATPRFTEVPLDGFEPDGYSLHAVRAATWNGLIFVCLDPSTPPIDVWFGDLDRRLAGYCLDTWSPRDRGVFAIDANWKLISENYQEYYHLPWVHPELSKVSRVEDHYRYQGSGMYCGQT